MSVHWSSDKLVTTLWESQARGELELVPVICKLRYFGKQQQDPLSRDHLHVKVGRCQGIYKQIEHAPESQPSVKMFSFELIGNH